MTLKTVVIW